MQGGFAMNQDSFSTARRATLAGLAGTMLAFISRTVAAGDGERNDGSGPCCGNGPPMCQLYGTGIQISTPQVAGPDFQFDNPRFGKKMNKGEYYWVFVPDLGVVATLYTGPGNLPLHQYTNPAGYTGQVFCVAPDYTLVLTWPAGHQPMFSTRALGNNE
jgi:hypothetical protein